MVRLVIFLVLTGLACTWSSIPPVTGEPPECSAEVRSIEAHVWTSPEGKIYHLPHGTLSVHVVDTRPEADRLRTPVPIAALNAMDTPITWSLTDGDFVLTVRNGGGSFSKYLGLASVFATKSGHVTSATATMNATLLQNSPDAKRDHVMCQEVLHPLGLGHSDSKISCMNDCQGLDSSADWEACLSNPLAVGPDPHDAEQLREIYHHVVPSRPRPCADTDVAVEIVVHEMPATWDGGDHH